MTDDVNPHSGAPRPRALRKATDDPRFTEHFASIEEVAELMGMAPVSLRQTMRRRAAGDAPVTGDAFIEPLGNFSGYLWAREDLTPEAIEAWRNRPKRGSWLNQSSDDEGSS